VHLSSRVAGRLRHRECWEMVRRQLRARTAHA
jgi:hypothetical protein